MKSIKSLSLILTLINFVVTGPFIAMGSEQNLFLDVPRIETNQLARLGKLQIETIGTVVFSGRKSGNQIIIQALGSDGKLVGQAESVTGLHETPIYVVSPSGLKKITLKWQNHK